VNEPTFVLFEEPEKNFQWIKLEENINSKLNFHFRKTDVPEGEMFCVYIQTTPILEMKLEKDEAFLCFSGIPARKFTLPVPPGNNFV